MNVEGKHYRTIWVKDKDDKVVQIIDQRALPHKFVIEDLKTVDDVAVAIKEMHVRGAGLIGATAGFGMYIAALEAPEESFNEAVKASGEKLKATRPTAVNLAGGVERQLKAMEKGKGKEEKVKIAFEEAKKIADEDSEFCKRLGEHGLKIIEELSKKKKGETVNILTHCNAGWLAFVDYGSATAPIYAAFDKGIKVHVWVDETRPRNQGARLTAWELGQHGVQHTIIPDNVGGHLMQHDLVDMCIVGADRTTFTGDVANKIGTYLKALAAKDNNVPFYVALPSSSFDWTMRDGVKEIPVEQRDGEEVKYIQGMCNGELKKVLLTPEKSPAANYGFDVTPARLVTGLICERGICKANEKSILKLFPEKKVNLMTEEGYVKFNCDWIKAKPVSESDLIEINSWRDKMFQCGLIGMFENGIGFGNISVRGPEKNQFIISGTATGGIAPLEAEHYTVVTDYDIEKNWVECKGPIKASSESMTHAIIYQSDESINGVIHVHNLDFWKRLLEKVPTTKKAAKYGTPEMAEEVIRLFKKTDVKKKKILVMAGHEEGVISFGKDLNEAGQILLKYFEKAKPIV